MSLYHLESNLGWHFHVRPVINYSSQSVIERPNFTRINTIQNFMCKFIILYFHFTLLSHTILSLLGWTIRLQLQELVKDQPRLWKFNSASRWQWLLCEKLCTHNVSLLLLWLYVGKISVVECRCERESLEKLQELSFSDRARWLNEKELLSVNSRTQKRTIVLANM